MRVSVLIMIFWLLGVFSCTFSNEFCFSGVQEFSCSLEKAAKWLPVDLFHSACAAVVYGAVDGFGLEVSLTR